MNAPATGTTMTMSALDRLIAAATAVAPEAVAAIEPTLPAEHDAPRFGSLEALHAAAAVTFPLREVVVRGQIVAGVASTLVRLRFGNPLQQPMEVVCRLPLPPEGAVVGLTLRCGDYAVQAELRERADAEATFAQARDEGHTAALFTQERADVHVMRVTRLPPGEDVVVEYELAELLPYIDGAWRWRMPTTIAPRYLPGTPTGHQDGRAQPDTDRVPDASRLQPPLRLDGGTRLDLEVLVAGPVAAVASSLHAVRVGVVGSGPAGPGAEGSGAAAPALRIAPSVRATLDRDFVLAIEPAPATAGESLPSSVLAAGAMRAVVVAPPAPATMSLTTTSLATTSPATTSLPRDAVFVVDISGSMDGAKLDAAKLALQTALHGLQPGDRFGLLAFDDRVEMYGDPAGPGAGPALHAYDDAQVARADAWIARLYARGGTEMLAPLQLALAGETPAGRLRTVLFLTDGQAWNEAELAAAVAARRGAARLFTFGIDTAVHESLLQRLARAGGGVCELASPDDDIEAKVAALEARFGVPLLRGLRAQRHDGLPWLDAGLHGGDVFAGRPARLLLDCGDAPGEAEAATLRLVADAPQGWAEELPVAAVAEGSGFEPASLARTLGALYGRWRIAALQDRLHLRPHEAEAIEPEILALSLRHQVLSSRTAWIAVETRRTTSGELLRVEQPAELPAQWAAPQEITGSHALPPSMPMPSGAAGAPMSFQRTGAFAPPPQQHAMYRLVATDAGRAPAPKAGGGVAGLLDRMLRPLRAAKPQPTQDVPAPAPWVGHAEDGDAFDEVAAPMDALALEPGVATPGAASADRASAQTGDLAGDLARAQRADGSFGADPGATQGDVAASVAALLALLLLGHSRKAGLRKRTVAKLAAWLARQGDARAAEALAQLAAVEAGGSVDRALAGRFADAGGAALPARLLAGVLGG